MAFHFVDKNACEQKSYDHRITDITHDKIFNNQVYGWSQTINY